MRHGPAEDYAATGKDSDRPLSPSGRARVLAVAHALSQAGESPLTIWTSPLVRSVQTAEIVALVTGVADRAGVVDVRGELRPGQDTLRAPEDALERGLRRLMIVGHEPDLSDLIARLTGRPPIDGVGKGMVVGLSLRPDAASGVEGRGYSVDRRFVLDPKSLVVTRAT